MYIYIYMYIYLFIYIYIYREREREGERERHGAEVRSEIVAAEQQVFIVYKLMLRKVYLLCIG